MILPKTLPKKLLVLSLIINIVVCFILFFNLFDRDDESRLYSSKISLCTDFARSYLKTVQKTDNARSTDNILSPESKRWEMAVDVETDFYNLCMLDLNENTLKNFHSTIVKKYQK